MTRDEAKKEWCNVHPLDLNLDDVVDEIYDDFENRSCYNCMFAYIDKNKKIDEFQGQILGIRKRWSYCKKIMINVTKDFCCNKWELKNGK